MQGFAGRKIMHFDSMHGAFGGFADPRAAEQFQNRLKQCSTIWCCVNNHPGDTEASSRSDCICAMSVLCCASQAVKFNS